MQHEVNYVMVDVVVKRTTPNVCADTSGGTRGGA
jgi:hypothetical protein